MKKTILNTILFLLSLNLLAQSPAYVDDISKVIVTAYGIEESNYKVTRDLLLNAQGLTAHSKQGSYKVLSYEVIFFNSQGMVTYSNKGNKFNETTKKAIKNTRKDGLITFANIKV
ncbi:MAG: hypothetical protein CMD15_05355 [Flavobacteriales bacterium]|nr:hypothetical protein [Flavobacteriales bacterium]|tara:strand:- start:390258 stop:390602 length:345 start_codon:yes stop_codon:yes gene_type:complete